MAARSVLRYSRKYCIFIIFSDIELVLPYAIGLNTFLVSKSVGITRVIESRLSLKPQKDVVCKIKFLMDLY